MTIKASTATHSIFRVSAEERGYTVDLLDAQDYICGVNSDEPPHGALFFNPQGHGLWVPVTDLSVFGDLAIRTHVRVARLRAEVRR